MDSPNTPDTLVCKICERHLDAKILGRHSFACKDVTELRDDVLNIQSNLSNIVNKAFDLRNQLNTNLAIERKKEQRRGTIGLGLGETSFLSKTFDSPEASPLLTPPKHRATLRANQFLMDKCEGYDSDGGLPPQRRGSKAFHTIPGPAHMKKLEFQDEVSRTLHSLKAIIHYGRISLADLNEVNSDISNDMRVKNEVNGQYVEIKDKQISQYIEGFLDIIQKLIKCKQAYHKKLEELDRIESNNQPITIRIQAEDDDELSGIALPPLQAFRSLKIVSLDDGATSDRSERKLKIRTSPIWSRRESIHQTGSRTTLDIPSSRSVESSNNNTPKRGGAPRSKSKFASPLLQKHLSSESPLNKLHKAETFSSSNLKGSIPQSLKMGIQEMSNIVFKFENKLKLFNHDEVIKNFEGDKEKDTEVTLKKVASCLRRHMTVEYDNTDSEKEDDLFFFESSTNEDIEPEKRNSESRAKKSKRSSSLVNLSKGIDLEELLGIHRVNNNNNTKGNHGTQEKLLSKGDLDDTFTDTDESGLTEESKEEFIDEDEEDEFPVVTARGYYSDSEIIASKKNDKNKRKSHEMSIEDFQFIKYVGEGAYGKIYLVKKKATGDRYAMKIVDYADRETTHNKIASLRAERDAYKSIKGDWVVKAFYTFSHQNYVCFVLEYMLGGDLQGLLEQLGCFEEPTARFYFAELVLAVESLHSQGIIHRDLKPDNVLIDQTGHIKLTDFGLSENGVVKIRDKISTFQTLLTKTNSPDHQGRNSILTNKSGRISGIPQTESLAGLGGYLHEMTPQGRNSIMEQLMDTESLFSLRKEPSLMSGGDSPGDDMYLIKNKNDEEVVFSFLVGQERRNSWINKRARFTEAATFQKKKGVHRIIGTPDYIAPEIINGDNCNNKAVDLWSLGVILYEFLVGVPPFNDDSIDKIFANIIQGKMEWPSIGYEEDCISPEAADLIKKLMNPHPKQRISIREIKEHKFFKDFEWKKLKDMAAPLVPQKKDIDSRVFIDPENIFQGSRHSVSHKKGSIMGEMTSFNTKRVDLLHQLNQALFNDHQSTKNKEIKEDKGVI